MVTCPSPDLVPCFNKLASLSDYEENSCDFDSLRDVSEYFVDSVCSCAAQGTGGDELVKPAIRFSKYDKFDTMLVKKKWIMTLLSR